MCAKFMAKGKSERVVKRWKLFYKFRKSVGLVKDGNDIYRCEGRLSNAKSIPYETRSPIILTRKHKLTELIVLDCHQRLKHAGQRQTLTELTDFG